MFSAQMQMRLLVPPSLVDLEHYSCVRELTNSRPHHVGTYMSLYELRVSHSLKMGNQCSFSAKKGHENCVLVDHSVPIMGIKFKETRQEVGRSLVKLSPCGDKQ